MIDSRDDIWSSVKTRQLAESLTSIDNITDMQNFLGDVMTPKEIIEISTRLEAARMLQAGTRYSDIIKKTRLSSRTVARISDWMKNGNGGYATVLKQTNRRHKHIPPVRAV